MISLEEVVTLLNSPELAVLEAGVLKEKSAELFPLRSAMPLLAEISMSGVASAELWSCLREQSGALREFGRRLQSVEAQDEQEFSGAETSDNADTDLMSACLGYQHGFGLSYACLFSLLRSGDAEKLVEFLRKRRIPNYKNFYRQLKEIYSAVDMESK